MPLPKIFRNLVVVLLLVSSAPCQPDARAQTSGPDVIPFSTLLKIFANQPDCVVSYLGSADLPSLGAKMSVRIRMARKQGNSRQELYPFENDTRVKHKADKDYKIVIINRPGQPSTALNPQTRTYTELPSGFNGMPFDIDSLVKTMDQSDEIRFERAGVETIDGYQATRIQMRSKGEKNGGYIYFANDPKNLLLRMETSGSAEKVSLRMSDLSLEVPDALFEIPSNYKRLPFDSFMSVLRRK